MQAPSRKIRTLAATSVVAIAVLATGSSASTKTPAEPAAKQSAQLVRIESDRDGGETYVWMVDGVQRGLAFR
jgi:hypothetical protein